MCVWRRGDGIYIGVAPYQQQRPRISSASSIDGYLLEINNMSIYRYVLNKKAQGIYESEKLVGADGVSPLVAMLNTDTIKIEYKGIERTLTFTHIKGPYWSRYFNADYEGQEQGITTFRDVPIDMVAVLFVGMTKENQKMTVTIDR